MKDRQPALWLILLLCVLAPLLIAALWGDVYADAAYQQFQHARAIARGVEPPRGLSFSPLYTLLLAPTTKGKASVTPRVALALSAVGWAAAVLAWFWVGLALGRPTFSVAISVLLALHPLQAQVLGLETGPLLALWGLATLLFVSWLRRPGPARKRPSWLAGAALLTMLVLLLTQPIMLAFLAPLLICGLLVYTRSRLNLSHVAVSIAIGAACYTLLCIRGGDWPPDEARLTLLLAALQLLVAAGFAFLVPRLDWLAQPASDKYALQRGVISLGLIALAYWQGHTLYQDWRLRPTDRLALYKELAQWLQEHTLPTETVGAQQHAGLLGYLSDRTVYALPDASQPTPVLLAYIARAAPDHCVALNSLAWNGVRSHPWLKEHYRQVHQLATPYDSSTPLTVLRYTLGSFDRGETIGADLRFFPLNGDLVPGAKEQLELLFYRLDTQRLTPGAPLHLTLEWLVQATIDKALFLVVRLLDPATGQVWAQIENFDLGTDTWRAGAQFTTHHALIPPGDLPPGDYALDVAFYPVNSSMQPILAANEGESPRAQHLTLAQVYRPPSVSTTPPTPDHALELVTFDHAIALLGYDAPERVAPGETLRVALYWRALQPVALDYKVFVHLLAADGSALSQADGMPVQWAYPTTQWQPGEYIRDEYVLTIDPSAPRGDYTLSVGLYDPPTNERLVTRDAAGNEIAARSVILLQIQVR